MRFAEGDRVRIVIPDGSDFDHRAHGKIGDVVSAMTDDIDAVHPEMGSLDAEMYVVDLDDGNTFHARGPDLEPVGDDGD